MILKEITYNGCPATQREVPILTNSYRTYQDEVTVEEGILVKGPRIITSKTKLRAIFWRNLNKDISETTKAYSICHEMQKAQTQETMILTEIPLHPWHIVGTDLFYLEGEYLLVSDYFSKCPFFRKITQNRASITLHHPLTILGAMDL